VVGSAARKSSKSAYVYARHLLDRKEHTMPTGPARVPKKCHFRPRGLAYVRIRGRVRYLGKYGSPESHEAYRQVLAELAAAPPSLPRRPPIGRPSPSSNCARPTSTTRKRTTSRTAAPRPKCIPCTAARKPQPILPVPADVVDATLPHLSPVVADMVRVHRLTPFWTSATGRSSGCCWSWPDTWASGCRPKSCR